MDAFWHDLRGAIRSLTKSRGFTAVAVLVFALGIGINTALFSLTNALFFRPLPVERPERLVYIYDVWSGERYRGELEPDLFRRVREDMGEVFSSVAGRWSTSFFRLSVDSQTELARGEFVTGEYFALLGVTPQLGRALTLADDDPATPAHAMVISDRLWERRFDRDPSVIGRRVHLCCRNPVDPGRDIDPLGELEIVGVMPPQFRGVTTPDQPTEFWASAMWPGDGRLRVGLAPVARLADGITIPQALDAVRITGDILLDERRSAAPARVREAWRDRRFEAFAATDVFSPSSPKNTFLQRQMTALTVVVAIVLLIAASNVAGLLIARGANRSSETTVRLLLGAGRMRIARLLLGESLLLASVGGVLGLVTAYWLLRLFHTYAPQRWAIDTPFDIRVLAVTATMCVGAGLVSGLTPALRAVRINLPAVLPGVAFTTSRRTRARLRHLVLIPQVALSLALLVVAGFHVRSLLRVELAEPGYETTDRIVLNVGLRPQRGERSRADSRALSARQSRDFYRQLASRIADIPGAASVAVAGALPLSTTMGGSQVAIAEETFNGAPAGQPTLRGLVSPGYFKTMGIRMIGGRDFDDRDVRLEGPNGSTIVPGPLTAILSESLARSLWNGRDPIGRRVAIGSTWAGNANQPLDWLEVVGVVEDVRPFMHGEAATPYVYLPLGQLWQPYTALVVAYGPVDPLTVTSALRQAVAGAHLSAEVYQARTLPQMIAEMLFQARLTTGILAGAGLVGLLLASVGLYGVISYSVTRRVRELGVRCALGANHRDIVGLVMKEGAVVTALGMMIGGALAWAALKAGMNTPIRTTVDASTMVIVPVILAAVVLMACYIPARRAARADPLESLRAL